MAFVVHPRYRDTLGYIAASIRGLHKELFRAQNKGEELEFSLTERQLEKLKAREHQAALLALRGFVSVYEEYREMKRKRAKRSRKK
ncbi:MAG: hypothetical protein HY473_02415 [Candidatus Sungbacteria bacterium]|uniref:Uncharacterized protein n=1 Tax=Candidatus Sungiibacteriota bacterium TaxID=2750080 RepID=A0A932YXI9_9BACT|nr:hypothetical protein [Candidatus Sungbacteria bacterium]